MHAPTALSIPATEAPEEAPPAVGEDDDNDDDDEPDC